MQQNQLWWCRTHYSKRASEHALREPPLRRTRRILNYLAVYLHAVPRPPPAISLFVQGIWVMCCAINIRIAGTKYFSILFLAKHLKLKITITFNLAQRTNILHCVSRQCWFVYHSLPSNITICLAHILSISLFLLCSMQKLKQKLRKLPRHYFICHLQHGDAHASRTWPTWQQQLGAAHRTQVCHLPSWHAPKCPACSL